MGRGDNVNLIVLHSLLYSFVRIHVFFESEMCMYCDCTALVSCNVSFDQRLVAICVNLKNFIMRHETKQRQQPVAPYARKLSNVSFGRATFVNKSPLCKETVVDSGCMAAYGCRF